MGTTKNEEYKKRYRLDVKVSRGRKPSAFHNNELLTIKESDKVFAFHKRYHFGEMALLCPHCFNIIKIAEVKNETSSIVESYDIDEKDHDTSISTIVNTIYYTHKCKYCGESNNKKGIELLAIDPNIAYAISELNQKGYSTIYSCEGHYSNDKAYISFTDKMPISIKAMDRLPKSWFIDTTSTNRFVIRSNDTDKATYISDLNDWVDSLIKINR